MKKSRSYVLGVRDSRQNLDSSFLLICRLQFSHSGPRGEVSQRSYTQKVTWPLENTFAFCVETNSLITHKHCEGETYLLLRIESLVDSIRIKALFNSNALSKVPWLIDVGTSYQCGVVSKKLQRKDMKNRR